MKKIFMMLLVVSFVLGGTAAFAGTPHNPNDEGRYMSSKMDASLDDGQITGKRIFNFNFLPNRQGAFDSLTDLAENYHYETWVKTQYNFLAEPPYVPGEPPLLSNNMVWGKANIFGQMDVNAWALTGTILDNTRVGGSVTIRTSGKIDPVMLTDTPVNADWDPTVTWSSIWRDGLTLFTTLRQINLNLTLDGLKGAENLNALFAIITPSEYVRINELILDGGTDLTIPAPGTGTTIGKLRIMNGTFLYTGSSPWEGVKIGSNDVTVQPNVPFTFSPTEIGGGAKIELIDERITKLDGSITVNTGMERLKFYGANKGMAELDLPAETTIGSDGVITLSVSGDISAGYVDLDDGIMYGAGLVVKELPKGTKINPSGKIDLPPDADVNIKTSTTDVEVGVDNVALSIAPDGTVRLDKSGGSVTIEINNSKIVLDNNGWIYEDDFKMEYDWAQVKPEPLILKESAPFERVLLVKAGQGGAKVYHDDILDPDKSVKRNGIIEISKSIGIRVLDEGHGGSGGGGGCSASFAPLLGILVLAGIAAIGRKRV